MTPSHIHMLIGGCLVMLVSGLCFAFPRQIAEFYRGWFAENMTSRDSVFSRRSSPGSIVLAGIFALILGLSLIIEALNNNDVAPAGSITTGVDPITALVAIVLGLAVFALGILALVFRKRVVERSLERARIHDPQVAATDLLPTSRELQFRIVALAIIAILIGSVILTTVIVAGHLLPL